MSLVIGAALALALLVVVALVWRWAAWPCPSWLVPLLENPYVEAVAGARTLLERAGVAPGMHVLDAGCGPGRVTLPASLRVGPSGRVVALDLQQAMLSMLAERIAERGLRNVELVHAGLGEGRLPAGAFDVALLVTVLGRPRTSSPRCGRSTHRCARAACSRSPRCCPTRTTSASPGCASWRRSRASASARSSAGGCPTR